ncbi:MAG: hypothetical protein R3B09_17645 [Nannocystaceae bacterium]
MRTQHVPIESPCHESWEAMEGGAERRFCGVCEKHVHNLSAMRYDDAVALLQESAGEHLCVRYSAEADGALRFRDLVPRSRLTRGLRRAAFAAVLLAACGPKIEVAVPDLAEVIVDPIDYVTERTEDGGCKFATGPFTTFHFPPGHAFCGPVDHAEVVTPTDEPIVGAGPFEPAVDPIERPTMGDAVADPEPGDAFVPCDPKTNHVDTPPVVASPPTSRRVPPAEPPHALMGDVAMPEPTLPVQGGLRMQDPAQLLPTYAPPPTPTPTPNPFPGAESPPAPPPVTGYAPPPTPDPFPSTGSQPPPPPTMGSVSAEVPERMGRVAPPR